MRQSLAAAVMVVVFGVAGAAGAQSTRSREASETATLTVDIHDYAEVPPWRLSRAVAEATAIFAATGVQLDWKTRRWSNAANRAHATPAAANVVTVQIIPAIRDDRITEDPTTLGAVPGAQRGGRVVYLFSSRIEVVARRNTVDIGALLGVVLAHELGHVLLKGRPHAPSGIMRPFCSGQHIHEILAAHGGFTAAETQLIRSRASTGPLQP